jgi:hypothetical protein
MKTSLFERMLRVRKALAACLIFFICAFPNTTNAQFGVSLVTEVGPVAYAAATTALQTTQQSFGVTIKNALDHLAWTLAKTAIQSITRSTVNWINSGFNGSPAFISDLNQNLSNLSDAVANDFFNHLTNEASNLTGFNVKSPLQSQLNQKLRQEYYRANSYYGLDSSRCRSGSGNAPISADFYKGNFNKGGFDAFFKANQYDDCNPFGGYQKLSNQLWSQIDAAAQKRKAELNWGQGFLPWRGSCAQKSGSGGTALSQAGTESCRNNSVRTPGALIEQSLGITATSPLRQLELADSINEIVGALVGQLVNQVLGPTGLSGVSQPAQGGGQSFLNQATDPNQYTQGPGGTSSLSDGVVQNLANDKTNIENYRSQWQTILNAATAVQQECGDTPDIASTTEKAQTNITRATKALSTIDTLSQQVTTAAASKAANQSDLITQAVADYQGYLASPEVPSLSEISAANTLTTPADQSMATTPSLLTQLTAKQQSCTASVNSTL